MLKDRPFLIIGSIIVGLGIGLFLILPKGKESNSLNLTWQSSSSSAVTNQLIDPEVNPDAFYINQKYLNQMEKASGRQIKNHSDLKLFNSQYLPYYYQESIDGQLEIFSRSKNGIQRYIFSPDNLTFNLSEQLLDQEKFIPKANSLPLFQYQDQSGQWQDYQIELPTAITIKNATSIGITLLQKFSLTAKNTISSKADGEVEFSLGFDGRKHLNKLTFRLVDNLNLNRLIWKNQLLDGNSLANKGNQEKRKQFGDVVIDWQDFKGETKAESQEEEATYLVYFYEKGQKGAMEIDPTVSLSASSTELVITADRYTAHYSLNDGSHIHGLYASWYGGGATNILNEDSSYNYLGRNGLQDPGDYTNYYDDDVSVYSQGTWDVDLVENSATRIMVRAWFDYRAVSVQTDSRIDEDTIFTPDYIFFFDTLNHAVGGTAADSWRHDYALDSGFTDGGDPQYRRNGHTSWQDAPDNNTTVDIRVGESAPQYVAFRNNTTSSTAFVASVFKIGRSFRTFNLSGNYWGTGYLGCEYDDIEVTNPPPDDLAFAHLFTLDDADLLTEITGKSSDYYNPDDLTFTTGSGWYHTSENTSASADEFNEAENAYCLEASSNQVEFDIDGGTYNRYKPFFKLRSWRSNNEPTTVTLEGAGLSDGTNYNTDHQPFTDAYFANKITWYSTLESSGAVTSPDVGSAGTNNSATFTTGKYGNGVQVTDAANTYVEFPMSNNVNSTTGVIEFWYKNIDTPTEWNCFFNADNALDTFCMCRNQSNTSVELCINGACDSWAGTTSLYDGSWHHIRYTYDTVGNSHYLYIDGVSQGQITYNFSNIVTTGNMHIGIGYNGSIDHVQGIIDEFKVYQPLSGAIDKLAAGGDTGSSSEYLGRSNNDYSLAFTPVDASNRNQYLFLGSHSMFRGVNIDLETNGATSGTLNLDWEYWNGTSWANLESVSGFSDGTSNLTTDGTVSWNADPATWGLYSLKGGADLYYIRASLNNSSGTYSTTPVENLVKTDILLFQYLSNITSNSQTFSISSATPTPTPTFPPGPFKFEGVKMEGVKID